MRVLSIFGTRPEAIKMAPVVRELQKHQEQLESVVCVTAQHREMLDQVLGLFEIKPDVDLDLMEKNQSPASLTARAMTALSEVLEKVQPGLVLVQGDTTTAMVAGLAAFYEQIPVGHVEAGLRTHSRCCPFPEEMNRRLLGELATYHFAPTERAAVALRREGVPEESIFLTGNPVIDALYWIRSRPPAEPTVQFLASLGLDTEGSISRSRLRTLLITAHRRESFGKPLADICRGLKSLVQRNPDVQVVYPVHLNPNIRRPVFRLLSGNSRIHLVDPLPYETLVHLMLRSYLILTDSGGLQEEGPAVGKPILVLRQETERPEGVETGAARVVGTAPAAIVQETERLLHDPEAYRRMSCVVSPYGDGHAAERIVRIIRERLPQPGPGMERIPGILMLPVDGFRAQPAKRALDVLLSGLGLLVSAPMWGLISLAIKLEDGGPVFYGQMRMGRGGQRFRMLKFRSMVPDAEQQTGAVWAGPNDGRVTRVGRFLRATALDELPQLLNIFKGEMSFVGPRPERPELVGRFRQEIAGYDRRFSLQPGLTGLAQVYGRYDSHPRHKLRYDLLYIKRRSFWLDLNLIALSFWITFRGKWESRARKV